MFQRDLTTADCRLLEALPGLVRLQLPHGEVLALDADDLERFGFLIRADEPVPPPPAPPSPSTCDSCFCPLEPFAGALYCPACLSNDLDRGVNGP
jgi:hypothetical protein